MFARDPQNQDPAAESLERTKQRMLNQHLRARGIQDATVLKAMNHVPREYFMPGAKRASAYADMAHEIGCGQTISQPYMVAAMTEALHVDSTHRVLEVGAGSGYQAAVLAELASHVVTIERQADLAKTAGQRLADLGYQNVTVLHADGCQGDIDHSPFDRILIAAATKSVPRALLEQLADNGILVAPLGPPSRQQLTRLTKTTGGMRRDSLTNCIFVPLLHGTVGRR